MPKIRQTKSSRLPPPGLLPNLAADTHKPMPRCAQSHEASETRASARGRPPKILGACAMRTQSARPEAHKPAPHSARETFLAQWRAGGTTPGTGLLVRPLLADIMAQLREGPWSCVEVWLSDVSAVGDDSLGPEVRDVGLIRPIVYAKADKGVEAHSLGRAVFDAAYRVLGQHPQTSHWLVSVERGADQTMTCVHMFADARRPALSLHIAAGQSPYAAAALPQGAIVCKLSDGDVLWRAHDVDGALAWDAVQAGRYTSPDINGAHALRHTWAQRTCGFVPSDFNIDRAAWAQALARRADVWPAVVDGMFAAPANHADEMQQLATLANAWLSADAQRASLGALIEGPSALIRARLSAALERTTVLGPCAVLHLLCSDRRQASLCVWGHAWALPQRLARQANDAAAPSMESVYASGDGTEQLRLRLSVGCFVSPAFAQTGAVRHLPPFALSPKHAVRLSSPWQSPMHAARLSAAVLGEASLMALWSGAQAPTQARLHLAAKRLMTLATKAQGIEALQLTTAAGALDPAVALRLWPAQLNAPQDAATKRALTPFVALWTAQWVQGVNPAQLGSETHLGHMRLALHALQTFGQIDALPMRELFAQLQPCVTAAHENARYAAPLALSLIDAAHTRDSLPDAMQLVADETLHEPVRIALCAVFAPDDTSFVRMVGAHIEALCALGDPASASPWLAAVDVSHLRVTDVVRLQLIVAGTKAISPSAHVQLLAGLQDADASLQCFVDDKQSWRSLCRAPHLTHALGVLLTRTSAPPQVLWEMWQGAADKSLSFDALQRLLESAAANHTLAWRLARERCVRTDDVSEVWRLMHGYALTLPSTYSETPRKLAAIVEAGCRKLQHLGVPTWVSSLSGAAAARASLREIWTRYAPGDGHAVTLQTGLQLLELRYAIGDIDAGIIDATTLAQPALNHPKLLAAWSRQIHVGLESAASREDVPGDAVFQALASLADVPYPVGRENAANLIEIGTQLVFSLVQWEQTTRAAAVLDSLAHRLNGATLVSMIHACTIGRDDDKITLPITLESCLGWLVMLGCLLRNTKTPSLYLVLVDGHVRASLRLLSKATLTVASHLDDGGSVVSDGSDEVRALDAHEALWAQTLTSIVDLHARCPIGRSRPLQRQLTEAVGRMQAHDNVQTFAHCQMDADAQLCLAPLWRAFVLSTPDASLAQTRASRALRACGVDIECALAPQLRAMPTPEKADAALGMLVDLAGVLVGAESTQKARLARFDAIAGVMLAAGSAVHRWQDLIRASTKSLSAETAKRRLSVLAQLVVQGLGQDKWASGAVPFTALSLVHYAEHVLAEQWPTQAQSVGNALSVYAQKQTTHRRDAWRTLLGSLNDALHRKGLRLGAAWTVLDGLCQTAPELAARGETLNTVGPSHLRCGVAAQLAHTDVMQAEIGFHYFVVNYGEMPQLTPAARLQMQAALVEALRWSHVRTTACSAMLDWDLRGVNASLVTDIFAALQQAAPWNADDIGGIVAVFIAAAGQGGNANVWAPIAATIAQSVGRSAYVAPSPSFKHAQVLLRATDWMRPLADALDVMLA